MDADAEKRAPTAARSQGSALRGQSSIPGFGPEPQWDDSEGGPSGAMMIVDALAMLTVLGYPSRVSYSVAAQSRRESHDFRDECPVCVSMSLSTGSPPRPVFD